MHGLYPVLVLLLLLLLLPLSFHRLKAMYYDRKRDLIVKGLWFDHPKQ